MSTSFLVVPSSFQSSSPPGASSRLTFNRDDADVSSSSEESSSIGSASDDEDPVLDGQDEAQSKSTTDGSGSGSSFISLSSLEDSLPMKRGLSNHFAGKSRSFSNLGECANANAGDIAKAESPFNRKRRILIASRFSYKRRASCSSLLSTCMLPPLLSEEEALQEGDEEDEDENNDDIKDDSSDDEDGAVRNRNDRRGLRNLALRSPRSLPLFDLRYA